MSLDHLPLGSRSCLVCSFWKLVSADFAVPFHWWGMWSQGFRICQLSKVSLLAQACHCWERGITLLNGLHCWVTLDPFLKIPNEQEFVKHWKDRHRKGQACPWHFLPKVRLDGKSWDHFSNVFSLVTRQDGDLQGTVSPLFPADLGDFGA